MKLLRYEWRRAKSLRTTWITSSIIVLAVVGFAWLIAAIPAEESGTGLVSPADAVSMAIISNPVLLVLVSSLGAMSFGHEYRYGTIRLTLTAFPRRTGVFSAKLAFTLGWVLLVAVVSAVAAWAVISVTAAQAPAPADGQAMGAAVWQVLVYVIVLALLAFSLTLITRSHPLGIIGPILLSLIEAAVVGLASGRVPWIGKALPFSSMQSWFAGEEVLLSVSVLAAWLIVLLGAGFVLFQRRDA